MGDINNVLSVLSCPTCNVTMAELFEAHTAEHERIQASEACPLCGGTGVVLVGSGLAARLPVVCGKCMGGGRAPVEVLMER